jgi:cytochrome c
MDIELNKIAGAVLGTCLFAMGLNVASGAIFSPRKAGDAGYALPAPEEAPGGEAAAKPGESDKPLPVLLASADATKGQSAARKCGACHDFSKGGPNKVGPNLYGVVGRPKGSHEGFNYSAAMKAKGGDWSFDEINKFIANPKADIPGTIMAFAGVNSGGERADILAYLRTLSDNPVPLPAAEANANPGGGPAPAGDPAAKPGPAPAPEAK